jgi:hypothetical protein
MAAAAVMPLFEMLVGALRRRPAAQDGTGTTGAPRAVIAGTFFISMALGSSLKFPQQLCWLNDEFGPHFPWFRARRMAQNGYIS